MHLLPSHALPGAVHCSLFGSNNGSIGCVDFVWDDPVDRCSSAISVVKAFFAAGENIDNDRLFGV